MKTKRFLSITLSIMILLSLLPHAFALEDIAALQAMIAQQQAEYQQQLETIQTEYAQMQKAAADEAEKAVQQAEKAVRQATCPHNYKTVQNRDVIPATCETDGSHTEVTLCLDCELELESRKVTDTALGHNYVAEVTTPATETEEGVRTYTCSECGDSYTETIPVDDSSSSENKQMRISLKAAGEASGDGSIVGPTGGYSLTLNPNYPGATSGGEEINITETTLPQLSRDGYLFLGWSKSSAGEVVYLSGDTITLTENTTLYAIWTINQSLIGDIPASKGGYVYLGGILWRVIGVSGDRYLLISADVLDGTKTWNDAKNYCGTVYGGFTQLEKNAVESTTKTNDAAYDIYAASNLSGAKLFLLSASEAKKYFSSSVNADRQPGGWWLRSPHSNDEYQAGCVDGDGSLFYFYVSNGKRYGSRPAFVLNRSSVLFESAAAGGKSDANGSFSTYTVPTTTVDRKLTLLDSSRSGFSAISGSATVAPGGTLAVAYSGAKTGTGEYVSAMLCDASGNPLYYASLTSAGSGTWNITIPAELAEGSYTLKVFSEQQNGDNLTDYAGPMQEIALTVSGTPVVTVATPTFSPAAGAYAAAQAVTISCATDGAAIYYTTDGTEPTTGSTVYSGPISVSETTTIKAIAVKDGMNNSEVASAAYTITPPATTYGITTVYCSAYLNIEKINAAESGETITVSADPETFPKGKYFTGDYSSDDVTVSVNDVGDGTFTMPDKAVSVTAVLADREETTIDLTGTAAAALPAGMAEALCETDYYLNGGLDLNGDGTVDVLLDTTNNTAQRGEGAGSLTSNVAVSIENPGLPYRYKSVTFKVISTATYTVTVNNGSGGGEYAAGASVTITANDAPSGQQFKEWTGTDSLTFTSGSATTATATFTMPANAVTVTATYEDIPAATYTVTYKVVNGTWADGTTADKTETVAHGASPASVPTGMIAGSGYTSGIWVPDPSTAVITEAATFVYEFISNGRKLYSITVTPPTKTQYNVGDELDTTGMVVLAYYDNGGQGEDVTGAAKISNFDSSVPGTVIVTVSYTERETTRTDTFSVTIVEPVSVSYNISVSASPSEGGTVTGGGWYGGNAQVTVTATANSGYSFVKWTEGGEPVSTSSSYTFTATANRTLVAVFETIPTYTLTVENGTGSGNYAAGASVTITANDPETGKVFKEWTGTDGLTFTSGSATTATATFTMPAQAVTVTATYEKGDDPAVVTPTASVLKGGKTVDLSKNITGAVGSLSFSIKQTLEGCSVTPDGVFTSGSVTGECVVQVTIWESTNYKGRTETITVTVSEEPQEEGRIETENHHSAEVEIKPANLEEVAQAVLTEPEKEELKKGTDITVWLQTDVRSVGEVPAQDAALLTSGAASLGAQPGEWIDISLHKQVGDATETEIHQTAVPVSFSIEVPERLRNTDSSVTRTFYLLRAHNGEQTVIASTTGTTLQGSSNVFSSYLLAYKDTPKEQFIIIWLNGDGTELDRKTYSEGEAEPKTDKVPTKAEDANYTYSFDKWDAGTKDGNITVYRPLFTATAKEEPEPPVTVPVYYFESGSTPVMWYQGSATGAKFVVHRVPDDPQAFSHFLGIQVDGRVLSPRLYTARSGSVEIMLSSAYQKSLPAGIYTLRADFDDGSAETKFVVLDAGSGGTYYSTSTGSTYTYVPPSNNPRTGDGSHIGLWSVVALASAVGAVLAERKRKHCY